jgi:hypothetical protein
VLSAAQRPSAEVDSIAQVAAISSRDKVTAWLNSVDTYLPGTSESGGTLHSPDPSEKALCFRDFDKSPDLFTSDAAATSRTKHSRSRSSRFVAVVMQ